MSAALNLEAAMFGMWLGAWLGCALWLGVHSVCARCARALGVVLGVVLGRVVAGRFWCSYAWVSLTQTAPVRPRGCVLACARLCTPVLACVHACRRSSTRCVRGVYAVWRGVQAGRVVAVWCAVAVVAG